MRTPQLSLVAVLAGGLGGAVGLLFGGMGGFALKLRALRLRVDAHDDEIDGVSRRVSKREGSAGRALQQERADKLTVEAEKILEAASRGPPRRNGAPAPSNDEQLLAFADRVFGPRGGHRDEDA